MRMRFAAFFAAGISVASSMAVAQTAEPAPPAATTPLPAVTVEATQQPKKSAPKKKAAAKQTSAPPVATAPQPQAAPSLARGTPGSGTGPVDGYLAEQTTTGTKTDTPLKEVPQSVSVVGKEQIRDQGVQNLQEALRYVPGVFADSYGYDSRNDGAYIRGLAAAYFVDGLRTTYGWGTTTAPIEPYALERVEVLRGPGAMLYGQMPTGGMVNAISKLPSEIPYREIGVEYGSFDFKQLKLDATGKLTEDGKWLYRIVGVARDAETQVDFVDNDRLMLAPSLTYRPTKDTSITVLGNFRNDDSGSTLQFLPQQGTLFPNPVTGQRVPRNSFQGEPGDYYDTDSETVSLFVDHRVMPGLELHHTSRYSHIENGYDSHLPAIITPLRILQFAQFGINLDPNNAPYLDPSQSLSPRLRSIRETESDIFNTDTNLTAQFATGALEHTVLGGADYMRFSSHVRTSPILIDNFDFALGGAQAPWNVFNPQYGNTPYYLMLDTGGFPPISPVLPNAIELDDRGTEVQQQTGIYFQDQIKLGNWQAVLGLRHDWLTIDQPIYGGRSDESTTGRAALLYNFDFGLTPYVSYSQTFTPVLGVRVGTNIFEDGDLWRAAQPIEGEQVELGFKYQPDGAPFMLSAAVYELKERNQVVESDAVLASVQGADVRVRGFEVEAVGKVTKNLTAIASYSYTNAIYEKYPGMLPDGLYCLLGNPFACPSAGESALFPSIKEGGKVDGIPEHLASLWAIYTLHDGFFRGLSLGAGVRYVGEAESSSFNVVTQQEYSVKTPSYTLFDAMVAYETEQYRWQLTAQNLEDEYYFSSCVAIRGDCGVGQARTIITSFFYKF